MGDIENSLQQQVRDAADAQRALRLHGHDSKAFYGNPVTGEELDLGAHSGVVSYEPTELVLSARGGTPLSEIEQLLADNGQRLTFEPPHFADHGTIGGAVASGLGGPARPWGGAPRDVMLGCKLLDGQGRVLTFGGQVMKNVAGYDISRLMAGAHGTLGILLEVSLKVLPAVAKTRSLALEMPREAAQRRMRELARQPLPLSGAAYADGRLYLRLSGAHASVNAWRERIGGERLAENNTFWQRLRDQQLDFFNDPRPLWRLSLAGNAPRLGCEQDVILDWGGAQRWLLSEQPGKEIRRQVAQHGGHAELFRRGDSRDDFAPLSPALLQLHRQLKKRFDPNGILNPGRLFSD